MTIQSYAIVESGVVTNLVAWDGETEWMPPEGSTVVLVEPELFVSIGYTYDGKTFTKPDPTGTAN
ncbi:TPA: hypothetical protein ACXM9H_000937 [Burkholderia multivorans]|uniref:hypothetical protein n=1 Tax=Burkholderia multivorans TaxID=87883 RepID=UPI000CFF8417|nr:hypothetical protein [Burkholderia multivorans]PRD74823.1 hypothetical protein C6P75_12600 [Burkholderia multivorans]